MNIAWKMVAISNIKYQTYSQCCTQLTKMASHIRNCTCMNRTNSSVTCSDIGIKLLYKIINVRRLYPKFLLSTSVGWKDNHGYRLNWHSADDVALVVAENKNANKYRQFQGTNPIEHVVSSRFH